MTNLAELAERLDNAAKDATAIPQLSATESVSVEEAYEIQRLSIDRRIARGDSIVGLKLGFTSKSKMIQMGVDDVIWGRLTDLMAIQPDGSINLSDYVHPRVEPEVAFRISKPLRGVVTFDQAISAVDGIAAAIELIHCFSLVHDDLPAMDDDDLRRGQPTLHVHTNEAMAILAGDTMVSLAFEILSRGDSAEDCRSSLILELSSAMTAMIAGQVYDTLGGFPPNATEE